MINKKLYLMNGKEFIYDLYSNLVKNAEKYENITRSKMLDQIIEALDNNELELASELQLIMKDKMELLQSKYIQYKKNIF